MVCDDHRDEGFRDCQSVLKVQPATKLYSSGGVSKDGRPEFPHSDKADFLPIPQ